MTQDKEKDTKIRIDYENIDVADIMAQIRKKIATQPKEMSAPGDTAGGQDAMKGEFEYTPRYTPEPAELGGKARLKGILEKIMKPFAPVIKLLVYPVHRELRETIHKLNETNRRLDTMHEFYSKRFQEHARMLDILDDRINDVNRAVNERVDGAFESIHRLKEYSGLLHNLSHNLVVEMTKLKIEEEGHKLKTRILEKDFAFLGKKEKALEKEIFK